MAGRILIADPVSTSRIALRAVLTASRYEVETAGSAGEAEAALGRAPADLILAEIGVLLEAGIAPFDAAAAASGRPAPPVIALADRSDPVPRIAALRAGAADVARRPGPVAPLLARIRSQLRAADTAEALGQREATVRDLGFAEPAATFEAASRIALVSHDRARAETWRRRLASDLPHAVTALAPDAVLSEADREGAADLFVIEAPLAHPGEALELLADLRARARTRHAAILIVHDAADSETPTMALDLGASDLVENGFHMDELALRIEIQLKRKRAGDRLRASVDEGLRLAVLDPLTGLFNRRYAMTHARRAASDGAFGVILADIDRFKAVNDMFGHAAGDAVLVEVARRLKGNVRGMDMVARIGGEEFLVFLPDPDPEAARAAAHRLCALVRGAPVALPDGRELAVTASFGVALARAGEPVEAAVDRADRALYDAKRAGRDTVTMARVEAA